MLRANLLPIQSASGTSAKALANYSLFIMLVLPCLLPGEVTSLVLMGFFLFWMSISKWRIGTSFFSVAAPIFYILLLGIFGASQHHLIEVIKDVWYVGKIIVAIGAGYALARYLDGFSSISRVVILAGVVAAIFHLIGIATYYRDGLSLFDLRDDDDVRGYFITVIGLALIAAFPRKLIFRRVGNLTYVSICCLFTISLIASLSRTYLVTFLVLGIVMKGWAKIGIKNVMRLMFLAVASSLVIYFVSLSGDSSRMNIAQKFLNSANEVSIQSYNNNRDINTHWRGFESYRAILEFQKGSTLQKFVGQGLGATIDIGFYMNLGGTELRYIPILHNGYLYVLVKFGLIGLFIYLYFVARLIRADASISKDLRRQQEEVNLKRFLSALGWAVLLTTFVIAGAFNKSTLIPALILIGVLTAKISEQMKMETEHEQL